MGQAGRLATALATLGVWPLASAAPQAAAFEARSVPDLMKALGLPLPVESKAVSLQGPDVAENGAAVQVALACTAPGVKRLLLLVDKNPSTLAALFDLNEAVEPSLVTNIKMNQSSEVWAVAVLADQRVLYARKDIKVTLGGCGN